MGENMVDMAYYLGKFGLDGDDVDQKRNGASDGARTRDNQIHNGTGDLDHI